MAKAIDNTVYDAALADIATSVIQHVTSAQPANFAGIAAVSLADIAVSAGLGGGDWTAAADGDVSGRKTTMLAQNGVAVDATGTATHVVHATASVLKTVTTCTSQGLTSGNTVNIPAHDYEFLDPT